ncbi:MAG: type II toxin-antitoxin system VapC family toxin [Desulfobacula sp.]|jgi:hypothetical protein
MKYLLDSNIIIYHLNGDKTATEFIRENINNCAISQITYVEVLSFDFENEDEHAEVKAFLECLDIFDTNKAIAIQCLKNRKKRKIKIPDNLIASTAQANNLTLVTRNSDDLKNLDINIIDIYENCKSR